MKALNSIYFGVGLTIILALVAALVGPLFVDWTAYRAAFEDEAASILGHPVQVRGTADASLLPTPKLAFTDVAIGDPANPMMTVARFDLEVELFPLLSGQIRVTNMRLDRPDLTVRVDDKGGLEWIADNTRVPVDPAQVQLDRVEIAGARIRLADARHDRTLTIDGIDALLEARSLSGPYKVEGTAQVDGEKGSFRINTGQREADGSFVLKAAVTPGDHPVAVTIDGRASASGDTPKWTGTATITRIVPKDDAAVVPWTVTAQTEADTSRLLAKDLEYRYGPEDRPFSISGAATVDYAFEPVFDAVLSARQLDLDRTLGEGPEKPVSFDGVVTALTRTLQDLPRPPIPGRIGFDIPGIVVGGSLVQNVRLDLATIDTGWHIDTLEAMLPGRTEIAATGGLTVRPFVTFDGSLALSSKQPATLVSWWHPGRAPTTLQAFSGRSQIAVGGEGVSLKNLDMTIGEARVTGEAAFRPGDVGRRARLSLGLSADRLDVEQVGAIASLTAGADGTSPLSGADVEMTLAAETLIAGDAEAKGVDVEASLADGTLAVRRFSVEDLAGARIAAKGTVQQLATTPDGSLRAEITADRLDGLAALARAIAPQSEAARLLAVAAPALAPARLTGEVNARASGDATALSVMVGGTAGGSAIDVKLGFDGRVDAWTDANVDLSAKLSGPDGTRLMRQLGFDVADTGGAGAGSLDATLRGIPARELRLGLEAALGTTSVQVAGTAVAEKNKPPRANMAVTLRSTDAGPILALSGTTLSDLMASLPVELQGDLAADGAKWSVSALRGTLDGDSITGALAADFTTDRPRVTGSLALQTTTFEGLGEMALGAGTLQMPIVASRNPWPEAPFGGAALDGIDTDIAVTFDRVALPAGLVLDAVSFAIRTTAVGLGLDEIKAGFAGGRVSGGIAIKKDLEGTAGVDATLKLSGVATDALAWRREGRPVIDGTLDAELDLQASGRTGAGLIASLSGGGTVRIADGAVRSFSPRAFSDVMRAVEGGLELTDAKIRDVFTANVDAGDLAFDQLEAAFTVAGGTLRAPNIVVTGAAATTSGAGSADLSRWTLDSEWQLAVDPGENRVAGAVPQVAILFQGPIDRPTRTVDVTAFSAYLTLRAFEKEVRQVEIMQADILEQEFLRRTIARGEEAITRRIRAEEAERLRLEAEERAKAEAAARAAAEASGQGGAGQGGTGQGGTGQDGAAPPDPSAPDGGAIESVPLPPPDGSTAPAEPNDDFLQRIERSLNGDEDNGDLPGVGMATPPAANAGPMDLTLPAN